MIKKAMNPFIYTFIMALASAVLISGCKGKNEKIDSSNVSSAQTETMAESSAAATSAPEISISNPTAADNKDKDSTGPDKTNQADTQNISTKTNTYTSGKISIQFPSVTNLKDQSKAAAIDTLMKENALSVIEAYNVDSIKDTLTVTCKVLSAGSNRITVTYSGLLSTEGAAHPLNIFYSNTIDVKKTDNIGFSKYSDPYTMAGYVMSNDCIFLDKTPQQTQEIRNYLHSEGTLESYTQLFNQADFPFDSTFPASFSYEHEGTIFFSVPVNHALGDYVIVIYTPDTK